jgi:4-hydroxy-2-oxoglutarate aldolase
MSLVKLHGIFPPITTPFDHRGDLYLPKLRYNVEKWNKTPLAGYVVCGSTGESVMLTCPEKTRLWETVREAAAPDKILIAGTGMESVRETVELCNLAAGLGYQAAMVRTPHYYKNLVNNGAAQALYYRAVADQSKIPLIIYNWPQVTGVDIPASTVVELAGHPNIIAVKESSGSIEKTMQMIREAPEGFQVLVGSAPTLWPCLKVGAVGAILAFANAAPYACQSVLEAVRTREDPAGLELQQRFAPAAVAVTTRYGIPGLKYAMDLNGYYGGPPRLPLLPAGPEAKQEIERLFREVKG